MEEKESSTNTTWMNILRGTAIIGVIIDNWITFLPHQGGIALDVIRGIGGPMVHLFFILSGCGLTISILSKQQFSWKEWANKRFQKIVIPYWIIIILTFLIGNLLAMIWPALIGGSYSLLSLLTYLSFTRNFYEPSWGLNPSMWFMHVIIGLYIIFPLLIKIYDKFGIWVFVILSLAGTYGPIALFVSLGIPTSHQAAPFLFFLAEFSFGIIIGKLISQDSSVVKKMANFKLCCFGIGMYLFSWAMTIYWKLGSLYNDLFTAVGIYLVLLYVSSWLVRYSPKKLLFGLNRLSEESYMMYLIHGSILLFVLKPILSSMNITINWSGMIIGCGVFCGVVFLIAKQISRPINALVSRIPCFQ